MKKEKDKELEVPAISDPSQIKIADKIWISIRPHLSHDLPAARELYELLNSHSYDVIGTELEKVVKSTGFTIGIRVDL